MAGKPIVKSPIVAKSIIPCKAIITIPRITIIKHIQGIILATKKGIFLFFNMVFTTKYL